MRTFLSFASLLVVLILVGSFARKQFASISVPAVSAAGTSASAPIALVGRPPAEQLQQFNKELDQAMQQAPRRVDDQ